MNPTLITTFWLHRLRGRMRMTFVVFCLLGAAFHVTVAPSSPSGAGGGSLMLVCILCIGMISQDFSSGTAHLILARPVSRSDYLFSRYAGASLGAVVAYGVQTLIAIIVLTNSRAGFDQAGLVSGGVEQLTLIFGVAAVFAFWSSLARGVGDLALYVMLVLVCAFICQVLLMQGVPHARTINGWITSLILPSIKEVELLAGGRDLGIAIARYVLTVAGWLALARVVLGRRELSYS